VDLYIHSPIRLHGVMINLLSTGTTLPFLLVGPLYQPLVVDKYEAFGGTRIGRGN
jgi:hypothetical protein